MLCLWGFVFVGGGLRMGSVSGLGLVVRWLAAADDSVG